MGNIHPNLNHLSESLQVMAQNKHRELRLLFIIRTPFKRNRNIFCGTWWRNQHGIWIIRRQMKWNPDYISPNHGKHLFESLAAFSVHLSESCVRNNMIKFHKLQATMHFARPHNDKMAAKVVINTGREAETIRNLRNRRQPIVNRVTCLLFTTGIRKDEYHPWVPEDLDKWITWTVRPIFHCFR